MKRALEILAAGGLLSLATSVPIAASDHGVVGQTFPIIEPDLLSTIENRLNTLQASGGIDRMNAVFRQRAEARIRRPKPVEGISAATQPRTWAFDPSVTIDHEVRDPKGNLIVAAGQTVNPLAFVAMRQALVFVDGDDPVQMAWATATHRDLDAKIILVSGSPFEEMTKRKRRFYFDQEGRLTQRFGIRHTPAVARQDGQVVRISEIVMKGAS